MINLDALSPDAQEHLRDLVAELVREPFRQDIALRAGMRFVLATVGEQNRLQGRPVSALYRDVEALVGDRLHA